MIDDFILDTGCSGNANFQFLHPPPNDGGMEITRPIFSKQMFQPFVLLLIEKKGEFDNEKNFQMFTALKKMASRIVIECSDF